MTEATTDKSAVASTGIARLTDDQALRSLALDFACGALDGTTTNASDIVEAAERFLSFLKGEEPVKPALDG